MNVIRRIQMGKRIKKKRPINEKEFEFKMRLRGYNRLSDQIVLLLIMIFIVILLWIVFKSNSIGNLFRTLI